jgi:hypothetical protein
MKGTMLMPREITIPVTFRIGSVKTLGLVGGPQQEWATAEHPHHPDRRYDLAIGAGVGNTPMAARTRHGDRRLNAHADLTEFCETLFRELGRLLEVPVFACCDQPKIAPGGRCEHCQTRLSDDQVLALTDCTHPTLEGVPAGEREPCPDCGLAWCQAIGAVGHEPEGRHVEGVGDFYALVAVDRDPCPRPATGQRQDGTTLCTRHQDPALLIIQNSEDWTRWMP